MKRSICRFGLLVLLAVLALTLVSCGSAALGSVEGYPWEIGPESGHTPSEGGKAVLTVEESTLPEDATVFTLRNDAARTLTSDYGYALEVELEGRWYEIPCALDVAAAELVVPPGETAPFPVYWSDSYGRLPDGHYRLVKEYWFYSWFRHTLSCEFTIAR